MDHDMRHVLFFHLLVVCVYISIHSFFKTIVFLATIPLCMVIQDMSQHLVRHTRHGKIRQRGKRAKKMRAPLRVSINRSLSLLALCLLVSLVLHSFLSSFLFSRCLLSISSALVLVATKVLFYFLIFFFFFFFFLFLHLHFPFLFCSCTTPSHVFLSLLFLFAYHITYYLLHFLSLSSPM
ncbi:MAG: hypothetical protein JOS17DRAFT_165560 [Linnemannia elongata]|nr:MAG: hypothetical protein JOS17DRAFT_165560 [Linnemannia elongata]